MKPPTAIGPAAKDDMNLDDTVPPDANLDMGTSKTVVSFAFNHLLVSLCIVILTLSRW
jgi:hypothetical protein